MKQLIRKILKEESLKHSLIDELKNNGIKETIKLVGGFDNLFKVLNVNSPMDFLHLFDDMDVVQSEEEKDWTLFRYKPRHNLIIYDRTYRKVYISYDAFWSVLTFHFGLSRSEKQRLTEKWLFDVHNLRGIFILSIPMKKYGLVV